MQMVPPHPSLLSFLGITIYNGHSAMVLELADGGSVESAFFKAPIPIPTILNYLKQTCSGMQHLAHHGVVHRDLACRNLLLSDGKIKISDFGMSRILEDGEGGEAQTKTTYGPLRWMAPESILKRFYSEKSDIWSFGIVCLEMLLCDRPYNAMDATQAAAFVAKGGVHPIPNNCPENWQEWILKCFKFQPNERPTFQTLSIELSKL